MEIIERLGAKTPKFWKRVQKIAGSIVLITAGVLSIPVTYGITLPAVISTIASYALAVGITTGSVAQLAVKPDKALELQKKNE